MKVQLKDFQEAPEKIRPIRNRKKIPGYVGQVNFSYPARMSANMTYNECKMNSGFQEEFNQIWPVLFEGILNDLIAVVAFCKNHPKSYVPALKCFVCKFETENYEYFLSIPDKIFNGTIFFVFYDKKNLEIDSRKRLRHRILRLE